MTSRLAFAAGLLLFSQCRPAAPPPRRYLVEIRQMAFVPQVVTVSPGDTVVWVNHDLVPHTSTADAPGGWDTKSLLAGASGQMIAGPSGEASYHCAFHPVMVGRVVIR